MAMRAIPCLPFAALLFACANPASSETARGNNGVAAAEEGRSMPRDVFVMRLPPGGRTVPLARLDGVFAVEKACLVFRMGDTVFLPGISEGTPVAVDERRVRLGDRDLALGERVVLSGGQIDGSALPASAPEPPPDCRWPVLRII